MLIDYGTTVGYSIDGGQYYEDRQFATKAGKTYTIQRLELSGAWTDVRTIDGGVTYVFNRPLSAVPVRFVLPA